MFKKILNEINILRNDMVTELKVISEVISNTIKKDNSIKELTEALNWQSRLLDQFLNNAFENDNTELDTVVLIPYRGKPYVFKDGQRINTDKASSFNVNWSTDSKTEVNVYNE